MSGPTPSHPGHPNPGGELSNPGAAPAVPAPQYPAQTQGQPMPHTTPYGTPPGYQGQVPTPPSQPKGLAIAAMVVGIVSLVLAAVAVLGLIGGAVAVILGIVALVKKQSKGMSITGIVTGAIALVIAAVILAGSLFLIGAATDATRTLVEDVDQLVEEIESAAPETSDPIPPATEPETEPEPTADAAEPEWTTVAEISGSADQQSDTIMLTGGNVRVTYDFQDTTGYGMIVGAIYVLDEGVDIMVDGGIPDVMITEAGSGETILRKGAGEYYVRITSANASYTVIVEELK